MTDERFERWIALLLRAGVLSAAAVVAIGEIGFLVNYGYTVENFRVFPQNREHETEWIRVIRLGLMILIATPVARVALSIFAFALERDWIYVAITILVLAILLYGLL